MYKLLIWRYAPLALIAAGWILLMNRAEENIGWCITAGVLISALLPTARPIRMHVLISALILSLTCLADSFLWR